MTHSITNESNKIRCSIKHTEASGNLLLSNSAVISNGFVKRLVILWPVCNCFLPADDQVEKENIQQAAECCRKILNHVNEEVKHMENFLVGAFLANHDNHNN